MVAPMGILPPLCSAASSLAWSIGWAGLMVATSKDGLVCAKAPIAVSARQIVSFWNINLSNICFTPSTLLFLFILNLHCPQLSNSTIESSRAPLVQGPNARQDQHEEGSHSHQCCIHSMIDSCR